MDMVTQSGGGMGSGTTITASAEGSLNPKIYQAQGAGEIHSRIALLKAILEDRGVNIPPS